MTDAPGREVPDPVPSLRGRRCLVTGATGFVGSWLADRLLAEGALVRCLVRPASLGRLRSDQGLEVVPGDVTERASIPAALDGVEIVFHVAGLIKATRESDYFRVNYLGTINLLEACRSTYRAPRVVLVSSLAAVGPSRPSQPVHEDSICRPTTPYGRSKLRAEDAVAAYRSDLPISVVRPPTVYGPRDRESLMLFRVAALGVRPRLAVEGSISTVHVADLVEGIILAATREAAIGRTYFIAGDEQATLDELVDGICSAVGRNGVPLPVPPGLLRGAGRAAELARHVGGAPVVFDRWKAEEVLNGYWACSNERAKRELGFEPSVPLREGLKSTARWYKENGWL